MMLGIKSQKLKPIQLRNAAAVLSVAVPVGYIIAKHVQWEKKPDSKRRMLIHQLSFWACASAALKIMLGAIRNPVFLRRLAKDPASVYKLLAPRLLVSTGLLLGGFEGGLRLARLLVPKQPAPSALSTSTGRRYIPPHLRGTQFDSNLRDSRLA